MDIAMAEMGTKSRKGSKNNGSVIKYLKSCDPDNGGGLDNDETDWCSAFVNWCMVEAGYNGTRHTRARSWLRWGLGIRLTRPSFGAIVVFTRTSDKSMGTHGKGHVSFYWEEIGDKIWVLGGNQGRSVSIKPYKKSNVLGYFWPTQYAMFPKGQNAYLKPPKFLLQ